MRSQVQDADTTASRIHDSTLRRINKTEKKRKEGNKNDVEFAKTDRRKDEDNEEENER